MTEVSSPSQRVTARILLIEDDDINRRLFADYLEYYGYAVLALGDGARLLNSLEAFQPHLLLLDLILPSVNGYEIIRQIRQHPRWWRLPILVVSGCAFRSDRQRALALGASDYLIKPVQLGELRSHIQHALECPPPQTDADHAAAELLNGS